MKIIDDGSRSAGYVHGYMAGQDEIAALKARVRSLEAGLQTIENLVNAPQWDTARRYRVGEIARAALGGEG